MTTIANKILKSATPTVRAADGVVTEWDVTVIYVADDGWKTEYSEREDVAYLGKTADQFTKSELIGFIPAVIDNHVFEAHWEAANVPPATKRDDKFDIASLAE